MPLNRASELPRRMGLQCLHQQGAVGRHDHVAVGKGVLRDDGAGGQVADGIEALTAGLARFDRDGMRFVALGAGSRMASSQLLQSLFQALGS